MNRWCPLTRPLNAAVNCGIFERIRARARSAICAGGVVPSINARSPAFPEF